MAYRSTTLVQHAKLVVQTVLGLLGVLILGVFMPLQVAMAQSPPDDWPIFQQNADHTGNNVNETVLQPPFQQAWSHTYDASPVQSMIDVGGTLYIKYADGSLFAADDQTGNIVWQAQTNYGASVAYDNGVLYTASFNSGAGTWRVNGYDALSGALQVQTPPIPGNIVTLTATNGVVYAGTADTVVFGQHYHALTAYDETTGSQLWQKPTDDAVISYPVVDGGIVYFGTYQGSMYALHASDGSTIWQHGGIYAKSSPILQNGVLYQGSGNEGPGGPFFALNATSGSTIWSNYGLTFGFYTSPAYANGVIYAQSSGTLGAFNASNGQLLWTQPIGFQGGNVTFANGVLYVQSNSGSSPIALYALNPVNGQTLWQFTGSSSFRNTVIANHGLYFSSDSGAIYAFQNVKPIPAAPTDLTVMSPTREPVLSWAQSTDATSYNVYRDGTKIDATSGTTYTDASAPEGSSSYYVTATNSSGESGPSNSVDALVDRTAPVVTGTPDSSPSTSGWYNQNVTIDWASVDPSPSSGAPTQPSPTTAGQEGDHTYFSDPSCDPLNNCSTGSLELKIDKTAPHISYSLNPASSSAGWDNASTTVSFVCTDPLANSSDPSSASGIATCPSDQTETADGQYVLSATATDNAGNSTTITVPVNIDTSAPTVGAAVWSSNPVLVGTSTTLTVPAADNLSGVAAGEYYIDSDPGVGSGTPMTYSSGNLTATLGSSLAPGIYTVGFRAQDAAGNWSTTGKSMLVVYDNTSGLGVTGKNKKDLIPSLSQGDIMPGLINSGQTDAADYGMTVQYKNGAIDPHSDFQFNYSTGTNCNKPTAQNCHSFTLNATTFDWLVIGGVNSSQAWFQGIATLTVDGVTTTNPFSVTAIDGGKLSPTRSDNLLLKVYSPGADPASSSPIYQATGSMTSANSVKI